MNQPTDYVMVRIDGKTFRCTCGCNVFRKPDPTDAKLFVCNSCGARFRGEKRDDRRCDHEGDSKAKDA